MNLGEIVINLSRAVDKLFTMSKMSLVDPPSLYPKGHAQHWRVLL